MGRMSKDEEKMQKALGTFPAYECPLCHRKVFEDECLYIEYKDEYVKVCKSCYRLEV